jgi:hypothetical protein
MCIQTYQVSMSGSPRGLDPTMQGDTRQSGRYSDGKRNARTTSQNPGDVRRTHLLIIHDRQIFHKPLDERLDSRLSNIEAWVQRLYPAQ